MFRSLQVGMVLFYGVERHTADGTSVSAPQTCGWQTDTVSCVPAINPDDEWIISFTKARSEFQRRHWVPCTKATPVLPSRAQPADSAEVGLCRCAKAVCPVYRWLKGKNKGLWTQDKCFRNFLSQVKKHAAFFLSHIDMILSLQRNKKQTDKKPMHYSFAISLPDQNWSVTLDVINLGLIVSLSNKMQVTNRNKTNQSILGVWLPIRVKTIHVFSCLFICLINTASVLG